jgi:PKD repeat protein
MAAPARISRWPARSTVTAPSSAYSGPVTLTWTAANGAASYNVYRNTVKVGSTTTAPYSDTVINGTYSYYVTAVNSSGQESAPSTTVTVVVSDSTFTAPAISTTDTSCAGADCSFTATGSPTLTWDFGNGNTATGNQPTTTYTAPGTYTVTVTNTYGSASTPVSCVWNGHGRNKTLACSV